MIYCLPFIFNITKFLLISRDRERDRERKRRRSKSRERDRERKRERRERRERERGDRLEYIKTDDGAEIKIKEEPLDGNTIFCNYLYLNNRIYTRNLLSFKYLFKTV